MIPTWSAEQINSSRLETMDNETALFELTSRQMHGQEQLPILHLPHPRKAMTSNMT